MILDRLRRKKKKPKGPSISRSEFLSIKPIRNPSLKWEKGEDEKITILITLNGKPVKKSLSHKVLSKIFPPPQTREKKIELDKIGSMIWELCDGETTVKEIVEALHEKYKMLTHEAEISLNAYFRQLNKRGLLGFILPEEVRTRIQKEMSPEKKESKK